MNDSDIWTPKDVAAYLRCSLPHVRKLAAEHNLPFMRLGKLYRFRRDDVLAWASEQMNRGAA